MNPQPTLPRVLSRGGRQPGPAVLRKQLGARLRHLRTVQGFTRTAAAEAIRASESKISRLELGRTGFKQRDVDDLLTLYGVTSEDERAALLDLTKRANARCWWHSYGELLPKWFDVYLGLEQAACVIRTYGVQLIPCLLQNEAYGHAVIQLIHEGEPEILLKRRLNLLIKRQEILHEAAPVKLWAILDEAALSRPLGTAVTMYSQIEHLIEMATLPHITIQMMPFSAGAHPAVRGPITYFRFPQDEGRDSVHLEQPTDTHHRESPAELGRCWHIMNRLALQALSPKETIVTFREILSGI